MNTLKTIVAISATFLSLATTATTLSCNWLESAEHAPGFYRPAKIVMTIKEKEVQFIEDTFLFRSYSPCWTGNWSSCAFGFTYYGETWTIEESSSNTLKLSAPGAYWSAELDITFEKKPTFLKRGEVTETRISGDDGDGVWFNDEAFLCQKI